MLWYVVELNHCNGMGIAYLRFRMIATNNNLDKNPVISCIQVQDDSAMRIARSFTLSELPLVTSMCPSSIDASKILDGRRPSYPTLQLHDQKFKIGC
jgi:hypothetical protein